MTPEQVKEIAAHRNMSVAQLRSKAMRAVMTADPTTEVYRVAWAVWNDGEQAEQDERRAQLCADGWVYYPRSMNAEPMRCPNGHEAHLTGGKRPVWTCRICDMTQTGYDEDGANGYYLQWQEVKA